jgi:hypothetical protein
LAITDAIAEVQSRVPTLGALAVEFPEGLEEQALRAASAIKDATFKAAALRALMPQLPKHGRPRIPRKALADARTIKDASSRVAALTALIPQLPEPDRPAVLRQALADARTIDEPHARAAALTALIPQLPEPDRPAVLRQALADARTIDEPGRRTSTLEMVATHWPAGPVLPWEPYWRSFIEDAATRGRTALLSDLSAIGVVILRLGGTLSVRECVEGLLDVGRWWP